LIPGITYVPDYLDPKTHDALLAAVDEHPWLTSVDHGVQIYGYSYNHGVRAAYRIGELPSWATALAQRLHQDGYIGRVPNQLVANDYPPGAGMFDHIDQEVFGDVVLSVSLGSTSAMQFTRVEPGAIDALLLAPKSLLVLSGEARFGWKHGIPARISDVWDGREYPRSRRVSLTFRAVPDLALQLSPPAR
jgi:alkylated DNA repair dioxygenase AlkB